MLVLHAMLLIATLFDSAPQNIYSDGWNKKSTLTTTEPVEIPGMVLEPGTYIIKLEEGSSRRNIIQVLSEDGSKLLTRLTAMPDYRTHENDSPFTFHKMPGNGPQALQSWYYPGDLNGLEFVYPKDRARQIAKATECHVMASNGKEARDSAILAVTPTGVEVVIDDGPKKETEVARQKPKP